MKDTYLVIRCELAEKAQLVLDHRAYHHLELTFGHHTFMLCAIREGLVVRVIGMERHSLFSNFAIMKISLRPKHTN